MSLVTQGERWLHPDSFSSSSYLWICNSTPSCTTCNQCAWCLSSWASCSVSRQGSHWHLHPDPRKVHPRLQVLTLWSQASGAMSEAMLIFFFTLAQCYTKSKCGLSPGCYEKHVASVCWILVPVHSLCCLERTLLPTWVSPRQPSLSSAGSKSFLSSLQCSGNKVWQGHKCIMFEAFFNALQLKKRTYIKETRMHTLSAPDLSLSLPFDCSVYHLSVCLSTYLSSIDYVSIYHPSTISLPSICHLSIISQPVFLSSAYHLLIIYFCHLSTYLSVSVIYWS